MQGIKIVHFKSNSQKLDSWIAMLGEDVIGHIYMSLEDGNKIKFLDAWVHEDYRLKGIFRKLWDTRWDYVKEKHPGHTVYAWCRPSSLPLLLEKGFETGVTCTYVEKIIE